MGRRIALPSIESRVRQRRSAVGMNQAELSQRAGLTRQTISAIESGQYVPNTAVALRLAQTLGCTVEDLFQIPSQKRTITAELPDGTDAGVLPGRVPSQRVQLARIGKRVLARPMTGVTGLQMAADGIVGESDDEDGKVSVDLLIDPRLLEQTVVVLGCDPALGLLGSHLTRRYPALRLLLGECDSMAALRGLRRGEAHAGGTHLHDPVTGEHNLPFIKQELGGQKLLVVTLTEWQQGLIVQRQNPKGIHGPADLARPDVAIVNRAPGAGSRALLDAWLTAARVRPDEVQGYHRELPTHMAVAAAVALGAADAAPGILAAAQAFDLDFIPLQYERFDLAILSGYLDTPPVQALLEMAVSPGYRAEVETLGGYDSSRAGAVVAEFT